MAVLFPDVATAQAVHAALGVEAGDGPAGTTTALTLAGTELAVTVTADDLPALRAALHSALRLMDAAARVVSHND